MGILVRVQECRIVLGCFGDDDVEPTVFMGSCEGLRHVSSLVASLRAAMDESVGVRPVMDYFWDGSSVWHEEVVG